MILKTDRASELIATSWMGVLPTEKISDEQSPCCIREGVWEQSVHMYVRRIYEKTYIKH